MKNSNIIFIVLDTLRADRIVINEKRKTLTPFIKSLAKNSFFFENCIANSPWTVPSHISMFTGLYQSQNYLISGELEKVNSKPPILAEILRDLNYNTICFSENAFIGKTTGLTRGFDEILNVWDFQPWMREDYKLSKVIKFLKKTDNFLEKNTKNTKFRNIWKHIYDRSIKIIKTLTKFFFFKEILFHLKNNTLNDLKKLYKVLEERDKEKPLFLFMNLLTTHDPYIPMQETFNNFNISLNDFKKIRNMIINPLKSRLDINIKSKKLKKTQVRVIKKLYDACVYSADLILKSFFKNLEALDLLQNSTIIITSDHGEHLGGTLDHHFWEHNTYQSVYNSLVKVPLIIYNSKFDKRIINDKVELKDLFHTVLHLADISKEKNKYLDLNHSIIHQINTDTTPNYIYGEYLNPKDVMYELINIHRRNINKKLIPKIFNDIYFLFHNSYKYIKYKNLNYEEFYDLKDDPHEKNPISKINHSCLKIKEKYYEISREIKNKENLKSLITKKEKESLNRAIKNIEINDLKI